MERAEMQPPGAILKWIHQVVAMANQIVIAVTIVERNPRRLWFPKGRVASHRVKTDISWILFTAIRCPRNADRSRPMASVF